MKVLMFGWEFPPHITGGLGTACYGITKALTKHNVEIVFVVPKTFGDEDRSHLNLMNAGSVKVSRKFFNMKEMQKRMLFLEISSRLIPYVSPEEYRRIFESSEKSIHTSQGEYTGSFHFSGEYNSDLFGEVARYAIVASVLSSKQDFDVIHAHDWLTFPAGIAAKESSGKPLVVHIHATEFDRSGENINQDVYNIERRGMEIADKVVTVSNYTRNIVIERYGIHPDKVVTVHNAVDPMSRDLEFSKNIKEKVVTFLGRVTFQKGPDYFVEAAYKVLRKTNNVRFVMAGSGDMLERMIKRVAELRIADKFHFTGFLRGDDVKKMFSISDVYVMPSVSEPFGISPLEAMLSNVPVIISKQSGVSEILNHAIKVDFWDVDELANAIYALLNYKVLSEMFKTKGKKEVESLKWNNAAVLLIDVYNSLIHKN